MVIPPLKYVVDHPAIDKVSTAEHDSCISPPVYRKAALKDSLQRAILNVFGVSSNITVSDIEAATQAPYYTSPPNTTTSTVGTHNSNT